MAAVPQVKSQGGWVILITLVLAMVLAVMAIPGDIPVELGYLRPEWLPLVLIYWVIALPHRVGLVVGWIVGLGMDVLLGTLLGQHALTYLLMVYVAGSFYQQMRMFSIWQQSVLITVLLMLAQLINYGIANIVGSVSWSFWYLMPAVTSAFMWPWTFMVLRFLRRQFNVN